MLCYITMPGVTPAKLKYFDHTQVVAIDAFGSKTTIRLSNGEQIETNTAVATVATKVAQAPFTAVQAPFQVD